MNTASPFHRLGAIPVRHALRAILMVLLFCPALAHAQFSDSYKFLKAVRDRDGAKVMEIIGRPGSTIINTRDLQSGESALHIVVARRDTGWLGFLLGKGANPNLADAEGTTALMLATRLRFLEGAQALLDRGAQIDKANNSGETPLIRAVQIRDLPLIRLYMAHGANPDKVDALAGMSARDYAMQGGRDQAVLDLLDGGKAKAVKRGPVQGPSL